MPCIMPHPGPPCASGRLSLPASTAACRYFGLTDYYPFGPKVAAPPRIVAPARDSKQEMRGKSLDRGPGLEHHAERDAYYESNRQGEFCVS
jgi:hypothetical protein